MIKSLSLQKKCIIVLCVALVCAYMYAFNPERPMTLKIGFYTDSPWNVPYAEPYKVIDHVIDLFEEKYPYVTVTYESGIAKSEYSNWLSNQIVQAKQPDLFLVPDDDFNLLASTKVLEDLTTRIADDHLDTGNFFECAYQVGKHYDKQYALPYECNPTLMCVNRDLLHKHHIKMPEGNWTTAEFYDKCEKVTNVDAGIFGTTGYTWHYSAQADGIRLFNDNGTECYFNTSETRKAMSFILNLYKLQGQSVVTKDDFDSGNVAFVPMTLAEYRTYLPYPYRVAKYSTFNWTCIELPHNNTDYQTPVKTSLFAMSSHSHHKDLAWEFLKMLTTDADVQKELMMTSSGVSVLKSVVASEDSQFIIESDEMSENALSRDTLLSIMNHGTTLPQFKEYDDAMIYADYMVGESIRRRTIDEDLPDIQKRMENYLK
ncbi:MAG: extracellular solute-binding protein [Erysipelotrichaceae bacterium]|nr:extracellular solute-binding protein [Erysipelotrichaceae bacterium]